MADDTVHVLEHPNEIQEFYLVSMPAAWGGHGVGVWLTEKGAQHFIDHIYDDSDLRKDKELWEYLHGVEAPLHTIRKISGASVESMVISHLNKQLDRKIKEIANDKNGIGSNSEA